MNHRGKRVQIKAKAPILAITILAGLLFGGVVAQEEPQHGGTISIGISEAPTSYNPWDLGPPLRVTGLLYNVLVRYDENLEPQPELAESWEMADDGTSIVLHLREGVKFHSGREMTAQDVVFSLETALDPEVYANLKPLAASVSQAVALDSHTVRLEFTQPNPAVFDLLDLLYIVDSENWGDIRTTPAGTGPFELVDSLPGTRYTFQRFDEYWEEGLPYLDGVVMNVVADPQAMTLNLETGVLDIIINFPVREKDRLSQQQRVQTGYTTDGAIILAVVMNVQREPFQDPLVRRAINHAINRDRLVRLVLEGSQPRCQPWGQSSMGYLAELEDACRYDPDLAREMLAEAGYSDSFEVTILTSSQRSGDWTRFAELLQSDLANIGVEASIQDLESAAYVERRRASDFQMQVHNFGRANKDPASLFGTVSNYKLKNPSQYESERYTELVERGATTVDQQERRRIYQELAAIIVEDAFVLNIASRDHAWAARADLHGIQFTGEGSPLLARAWLEE
ncbi:MAG: ABC transporter substrate-binding protein [Trueperaceae bacterium]